MRTTESLERRCLLAADVLITSHGTLVVNGDVSDNRIEIEFDDDGGTDDRGSIRATVYPLNDGDDDSGNDDKNSLAREEFDFDDFRRIAINGFGGNDLITLGDELEDYQRHVTIAGQDGVDRITAETNGPLLIDGGSGNDRLGDAAVLDYGDDDFDIGNLFGDDASDDVDEYVFGPLGPSTSSDSDA
jgi:hypothetical protein